MYHYCYNIHIFSYDLQLEYAMNKISIPEGLLFHIDTAPISQFYTFSSDETGFLILDLSSNAHWNEHEALPERCSMLCRQFKNLKIILCADSSLTAQLPADLLASLSDIWAAPFTDELIRFFFTNFVNHLKQEKDLWMSKSYLDTTINSIPDLIWYKDIRGSHLKVNDGFSRAVGKSKEDCEGRGHYYIWDLKAEEYEKGEYVCLETEEIVLRERKTCLFDEQVKSKEGMRQFKTYKSPIFDEYGELAGTVGIAHDVTDFDNIGAELEIILGSLPFAALITDAGGLIVNVNDMFLEYFRIPKDSILQMHYPVFRKNTLGIFTFDAAQKHIEVTLEYEDQTLILEIQETMILDVFQQEVGHFCSYRDITEHKNHLEFMENYQKHLEADVKAQVKMNQLFQKNMLIGFADIISSRDTITGGHIKRTSKYVEILVNAMKNYTAYDDCMTDSFIDHIYLSAPLHDIGKVSIPDNILLKPGKFAPSEYEIMKKHTSLGGNILDTIMPDLHDSEYYRLSKDMAKFHHERWDGSGYPLGLKGISIPFCARIMAVADVFDALTSERPYKEAFPMETARQIILEGRGSHFDPAIVDIFLDNFAAIEAAANEFQRSI